MNRACSVCGLSFFREDGYYVGAMMMNYGATAAIVIAAYLLSRTLPVIWNAPPEAKIPIWMAAGVAISLLLVPISRGLWLAFDYWIEPWEPADPLLRKNAPIS